MLRCNTQGRGFLIQCNVQERVHGHSSAKKSRMKPLLLLLLSPVSLWMHMCTADQITLLIYKLVSKAMLFLGLELHCTRYKGFTNNGSSS